jgi:hypothetical protein
MTDLRTQYEQLGLLYLGGVVDGDAPPPSRPFLVKSKDLVTHAVIVGMTGSGKTGLGAVLLEECAIDGVPAIVIDPKGDLTNLCLTFPGLEPASFAPWVGQGEDAAVVADKTRQGLAEWHQDPARIGAFSSAVERVIYTPGSKAGRPLSIVQGFDAPAADTGLDADEVRRARAVSLTSSLLSLAGIEGDPVASPEHVLVSSVLLHLWAQGPKTDLGQLLAHIQNPPFARLGLMETDVVAPPAMRQTLALRLNTAFASPALQGFLEGEPLDVARLLYSPEGRPRLAILTLAHLPDALRMFFVTLLLNEVLAWARHQPGTSSLRAVVYMDEVAGYLPPVANPPSKQPIMTLMKQARAFGVGCVLATQNPVDVDYKALGNAGLWFLGRLQTERDKARVLDGLEGSASATGVPFSRSGVDAALSALPKRSFYVHNVHASAPAVFSTRYALSYLRGPLTPPEIQKVTSSLSSWPTSSSAASSSRPASASPPSSTTSTSTMTSSPPPVPSLVAQRFLPPDHGEALAPMLWAKVTVRYAHAKSGTDTWQTRHVLVPIVDEVPAFDQLEDAAAIATTWTTTAPAGARYVALPTALSREKTWQGLDKSVVGAVVRGLPLVLLSSPATGIVSAPGEAKGAFIQRVAQRARELRDEQVEKAKATWQPKIERAEEALRKAREKQDSLDSKRTSQMLGAGVDVGVTMLGALFGSRRSVASAAGRAAKTASRTMGGGEALKKAEADVEAKQAALTKLQTDAEAAFEAVHETIVKKAADLVEVSIPAKKADVTVETLGLLWR